MKLFLAILFCSCSVSAFSQIGTSNPGRVVLAKDSFSTKQIGKANTTRCPLPGTCQSNCVVYTFIGTGNWSIEGNWEGGFMPPATLSGCVQIIINPKDNTECLMNIPLQQIPSGASIVVAAGKKFRIPGKLIQQ